jgi:dTDP-4-dehydrorhamnose reductase
MKIAITGHSGHIGAQLLSSVPAGIEFITLGRRNSDVYWKLGLLPDPSQLVDVDAIVHLAWATTNRKTNFHTNIGGTIQLANLANDLGCPFLFISSVGVNSESLYGKSKFLAEKGVIEVGGQVIRLGLMRTTNRYLDSNKKLFTIYPRFKNLIPVTEFDTFTKYFIEWSKGSRAVDTKNNDAVTVVDDYHVFSNLIYAKFKVAFPEKIIGLSLRLLSKFNYRIADFHDGFKTISTRKDFN